MLSHTDRTFIQTSIILCSLEWIHTQTQKHTDQTRNTLTALRTQIRSGLSEVSGSWMNHTNHNHNVCSTSSKSLYLSNRWPHRVTQYTWYTNVLYEDGQERRHPRIWQEEIPEISPTQTQTERFRRLAPSVRCDWALKHPQHHIISPNWSSQQRQTLDRSCEIVRADAEGKSCLTETPQMIGWVHWASGRDLECVWRLLWDGKTWEHTLDYCQFNQTHLI